MNRNVNLFLDLDETLVHTLVASTEKQADKYLDEHSEHFVSKKFKIRHDACWYVTFKRNITDNLIKFCKELVGEKNVYILSHGSLDYVLWVNVYLDLGIDPNTQIYGREDIGRHHTANPKFKGQFNILIDNESYDWHGCVGESKLSYLDEIPKSQFIQIEPFSVFELEKKEEKILEDVKNRILTCL